MLDKVSCVPIFARLLLLLDEGLFNWCQLQMCFSQTSGKFSFWLKYHIVHGCSVTSFLEVIIL